MCPPGRRCGALWSRAGLDHTILPAEYRTVLPTEETLIAEINRAREMLRRRTDQSELGKDD